MRNYIITGKRRVAATLVTGCVLVTVFLCLVPAQAGQFAPVPTRKPSLSFRLAAFSSEDLLVGGKVVEKPPQVLDNVPRPARKPGTVKPQLSPSTVSGIPPVPARKPSRQAAESPAAAPAVEKAAAESASIETAAGNPQADAVAAEGAAPEQKVRLPQSQSHGSLSSEEARLYKEIFVEQAKEHWPRADDLIAQLRDDRLMGHVLYQRYMSPNSDKTNFADLVAWMEKYADHPQADKIYALTLARRPKDDKTDVPEPIRPDGAPVRGYIDLIFDKSDGYVSDRTRTRMQRGEISRLADYIGNDLSKGAPTRAFKRLTTDATAKLLEPAEYDDLRAQIAESYLYEGKRVLAYDLASSAAARSGNKVPLAGWVAGLISWQQGNYKRAASFFEMTATSPFASSWTAASGAYWASRAHMRAGDVAESSPWLQKAASYPRTFYGLIATRALGWDFDFNWDLPELTQSHLDLLDQYPAGRRAVALVAAGQYYLAEQELRQIVPGKDKDLQQALLAFSSNKSLPSYAMRLAEAISHPGGGFYDAALYPLSPWKPDGGFTVDRALIHALVRQESRFNPYAESGSGAVGLMQLMPDTASYISGIVHFNKKEAQRSLHDPRVNLEIGQRYVQNLLKQEQIRTELFSLVMAYNAGPGNLRKWKNQLSSTIEDPLLFIESIPMAETRTFVERVMANYWIYRMRLEQPTPSLDAVAEGRWARYVQLEGLSRRAEAYPINENAIN